MDSIIYYKDNIIYLIPPNEIIKIESNEKLYNIELIEGEIKKININIELYYKRCCGCIKNKFGYRPDFCHHKNRCNLYNRCSYCHCIMRECPTKIINNKIVYLERLIPLVNLNIPRHSRHKK